MRRLRRILGFLFGLEIAVLTATGIGLGFVYRPTVSDDAASSADRAAEAFRRTHEIGAVAALVTGVLFALVVVADGPWQHWRVLVRGAGVAVLAPLVFVTGTRLAWDEVVLAADTTGDDVVDFLRLPLDDAVQAVVIDGTDVEPVQVIVRLALHGFLTVVLLAFAFVRRPLPESRPSPGRPAESSGATEDSTRI